MQNAKGIERIMFNFQVAWLLAVDCRIPSYKQQFCNANLRIESSLRCSVIGHEMKANQKKKNKLNTEHW